MSKAQINRADAAVATSADADRGRGARLTRTFSAAGFASVGLRERPGTAWAEV